MSRKVVQRTKWLSYILRWFSTVVHPPGLLFGWLCWGMVSSLLVLMNDKPCVLMCSMKVKRCILLIRAMDNMQYEEIELAWRILELDDHEGYNEDFLYLLSLRFYCEEPSITLYPLTLMHTDLKSKNHKHEFYSLLNFEQLSCLHFDWFHCFH